MCKIFQLLIKHREGRQTSLLPAIGSYSPIWVITPSSCEKMAELILFYDYFLLKLTPFLSGVVFWNIINIFQLLSHHRQHRHTVQLPVIGCLSSIWLIRPSSYKTVLDLIFSNFKAYLLMTLMTPMTCNLHLYMWIPNLQV